MEAEQSINDAAAQLVSQWSGVLGRVGSQPEELLAGLELVARAVNVLSSYQVAFTAGLERLPSVSEGGVEVVSGFELAVSEIAVAQALTTHAAARQVELARDVTGHLPLTLAAMRAGDLDLPRARVLVEELVTLADQDGAPIVTEQVRAEVEELLVPLAHTLTTAQLRARLRRQTARRLAAARLSTRARGRRQCVHTSALPGLGGLGELHAVLPADALALAETSIDAMARALDHLDPARLPEALAAARPTRQPGQSDASFRYEAHQWARSEALAAIFRAIAAGRPLPWVTPEKPDTDDASSAGPVLGWWLPPDVATRQGRAPHLNITVSMDALSGRSQEPADLDGYGLIPADLARTIATQVAIEGGSFSLLGLDQDGQCAHVGTRTRYQPTQRLRDTVIARHRRCQARGCRRPAVQCDLDHVRPHARGGPTCVHNLIPLCRFHHRLKTHAGWQVRPAPTSKNQRPGTLEWITRYGTRRLTQPEPLPGIPHPGTAPPRPDRGDPPF